MLLIITFLLSLIILNLKKGLIEGNIRSILIFSFSIVFITEILSLFKCVNVIGIYTAWSLMILVCWYLIFKKKKESFSLVIFELKKLKTTFQNNFSKIEKGYVLIILSRIGQSILIIKFINIIIIKIIIAYNFIKFNFKFTRLLIKNLKSKRKMNNMFKSKVKLVLPY